MPENNLNKKRRIFASPLSRRLTMLIILVSSVITLLLTSIQLYITYRTEISGIEKILQDIESVHTKALAQSLWAANKKEIVLQLEGITQTPNINYAAVIEYEHVWAAAGKVQARNEIIKKTPLTYLYRDKPQHIGTLEIHANIDAVYAYLITQAAIILASNAFKTFLVAAFMLLMFHKQINRFLIMITEHVSNLRIDTPAERLKLPRKNHKRKNELDALAAAINDMHNNAYHIHAQLNKSKEEFHAIADYTVDWESWFDPRGKLLWVNPSVMRITGYTQEECMAMPDYPLPIIASLQDQKRLKKELEQAKNRTLTENIELQIMQKDGTLIWIAISWQPTYDSNDKFSGFRTSARDISYLKHIEHTLQHKIQELENAEELQKQLLISTQQEKARITSLLGAMNIGILFEDIHNRVVYINPTFRRIWLIPDSVNLSGEKAKDVLEHSANVLSRPDHFSKHVLYTLNTHEISESFEIDMADGRVVTQMSYPVHDADGIFIGRLWMYEDVTRERQTAEQLIYLAERDSLTGLYNRHRFQEELSRTLANASRNNTSGALLFFDLDEFKYINDNFGHRAGDAMLIRVAGEISSLVRHSEILARIGGDEFAILISGVSKKDAIHLAERIIRTTGQIPFRFEGQNLRLTTSLGIATYPDHGDNAEELIAHADTAMYQAKDHGKNGWRVYSPDHDASKEMLHRLTWQERISNAFENNLFRLHFQGVYNTASGELSHLEALVRMLDERDPSLVIMPGHFIPVAEKTGKILDIDRWVIKESIRLLAKETKLSAIAVNISGRSFDDPYLPNYIQEQLRKYAVEPSRLMVELTETAAVSDLHDAQRFIESLHQSDIKVCLDDFGSGFSSFAYLKHLRADILKIDGLFIRDLPNDHDNQVFVKSIVDVAKGMHKITIAEFVENEDTLHMLRNFGVDLVQGYYLDMPQEEHAAFTQSVKTRQLYQ